jgi:hypothetical protein
MLVPMLHMINFWRQYLQVFHFKICLEQEEEWKVWVMPRWWSEWSQLAPFSLRSAMSQAGRESCLPFWYQLLVPYFPVVCGFLRMRCLISFQTFNYFLFVWSAFLTRIFKMKTKKDMDRIIKNVEPSSLAGKDRGIICRVCVGFFLGSNFNFSNFSWIC